MHSIKRVAFAMALSWLCSCQPPPPKRASPPPEPDLSGSSLFINVNPTGQLQLVGKYDFELLGPVTGTACVSRSDDNRYWFSMESNLVRVSRDRDTQNAVSAAALDAIGQLKGADTLVLTSVTSKARSNEICADVRGRAVRLVKLGHPTDLSNELEDPNADTNLEKP